jgi:hypothetical protein
MWVNAVVVCRGPAHAQDFWSTDRAVTADDLPEIDQVIQFPVFAQALVMGYNVPAIACAGDPDLVSAYTTQHSHD